MKYNLRPDERATLELRGLYEKYGYKKYKIGKFEEYSLYAANRDFLADDKVLTFEEAIYEIADLAYHLMVMMVEQGIGLDDVIAELAKRHVIDHKVKQERMA